jgi:hypothetical protein
MAAKKIKPPLVNETLSKPVDGTDQSSKVVKTHRKTSSQVNFNNLFLLRIYHV